ncbi:hypothetical protein P3T43_001534 [Paraburkholderia sp. GAS41]|jgi:hypothetical protein
MPIQGINDLLSRVALFSVICPMILSQEIEKLA